jgi:protein-disulfide isomerase
MSLISLPLLLAAACNPQGGGSEDAPAASAPKAADPEACKKYDEKVCAAAGEQSTTCAAVREATSLMPAAACAAALAEPELLDKKLAEARKSCDTLMTKLCGDLGEGTDTCKMVKETTPEFPTERCTAMLAHYDEVLADLKRQEAKNKPLDGEKLAAIAADDAPAFGPADAKVTLVEFSDFQCPFCSRAANVVSQVKEKYGDRVRFVFRQFPLSFHKQAHLAAQASLAAHAQGKFWEYHDKLFADQTALDRAGLEASAKAVGLDMGKFKKALDDSSYADAVDSDHKLGQEVAVDGTPTVFINGKRAKNPTDFAAISAEIDALLNEQG